MNRLLAVVLGGGAGRQLFPLTRYRAKAAVPLAGKYRLVDVALSNCIHAGISRIYVLTQNNSASLNRHVTRTYQFDRFRSGFVSLLVAEQTAASQAWYRGAVDAIRQNLSHLSQHNHTHVLVLFGDQLYLLDFERLFAHHVACKADVTVATAPVSASAARTHRICRVDASHRVTAFESRPEAMRLSALRSDPIPDIEDGGLPYRALMGVYLFNREVLEESISRESEVHGFAASLMPGVIAKRRVVSYLHSGYWSDLGTIRCYFEANLELARRGPRFNLYGPEIPLFTSPRMLPPARIRDSYVQDALVGEASLIVNSHISNAIIGTRSYIGRGATVKNSIIIGNSPGYFQDESGTQVVPGIGEEAYVEGAIIDRNACIGSRCIIHNRAGVQEGEGPGYYIRDGIVIIPRDTRILDGTIL